MLPNTPNTVCPEEVWDLLLGELQKATWTRSWAHCWRWLCLSRGWTWWSQRSLPTPTSLGLCTLSQIPTFFSSHLMLSGKWRQQEWAQMGSPWCLLGCCMAAAAIAESVFKKRPELGILICEHCSIVLPYQPTQNSCSRLTEEKPNMVIHVGPWDTTDWIWDYICGQREPQTSPNCGPCSVQAVVKNGIMDPVLVLCGWPTVWIPSLLKYFHKDPEIHGITGVIYQLQTNSQCNLSEVTKWLQGSKAKKFPNFKMGWGSIIHPAGKSRQPLDVRSWMYAE